MEINQTYRQMWLRSSNNNKTVFLNDYPFKASDN